MGPGGKIGEAPASAPVLIAAVATDLCLGFANTLCWRGSDPPTEQLNGFSGFLAWLERNAGVSAGALGHIVDWSEAHRESAAGLLTEAKALREAIYSTFSAVAEGGEVPEADFTAIADALAQAPARRQLAQIGGRYCWRIEAARPSVPYLLAPVLWSAGDLLLEQGRARVRRCANDKCLWLYVDRSRTGSRRWCDMASCGNRAKARRHYLRSKAG
jgi:predicted RNA-binding Zn ribbon-like protein